MRETVHALTGARLNLQRISAAEARSQALGFSPRREWIDWFSLQTNLVIDLPGQSDRLIYLVAHLDKTDINPLKVASELVNGALDEPIGLTFAGEGALDDASGVAVVLDAARVLRERPLRHHVRVLLTGSEESGLRGARAHVARLGSDEFSRIDAVLNVDSVGKAGSGTCLVPGLGSRDLVALADRAALELGLELKKEQLWGVAGDHEAFASTSFLDDFLRGTTFSFVGGLLPQRSWFTSPKKTAAVAFTSCGLLDAGDLLSSVLLLPVGQLHGPRDNAAAIDPARLTEASQLVERLAVLVDERERPEKVAAALQ
ncbi:MAG: M20/M25/M40 family metallo-hydrolase [Myxococcales bacterium]